MIIFRKFLFCTSLRTGCLAISYFLLVQGFIYLYFLILLVAQNCPTVLTVWITYCQTSIISGLILLAASHNASHFSYLMPIQIVIKLTSLICELVYFLIKVCQNRGSNLDVIIYSSISVPITVYTELIVFSYYHEMELTQSLFDAFKQVMPKRRRHKAWSPKARKH